MKRGYKARVRALLACLVTVGICAVLAGCAGNAGNGVDEGGSGSAGSVAATVFGHEIMEDEVTEYIDTFRNGMQLTDDATWAQYLADAGVTADQLRHETIFELAYPVVVKAKADELGIEVDESAVEDQVNSLRNTLLIEDDESWQSELALYGMSEDKLHENMANRTLKEQVFAEVAGDIEPTDEQMAAYVAENLAGTSTKKVICIFGNNYDYVQAALSSIEQAPSIAEGVDALRESPHDAGVEFAIPGWDLTAKLTSNMKRVISYLENGELADAPLGEDGFYYLFYIEDAYTFPSDGAAIDWPDEDLEQAVSDLTADSLADEEGAKWLRQQLEENVQITDMPRGLSYDIELPAATESDASSDASEEAAEAAEATEAAAEDGTSPEADAEGDQQG